MPPPLQVDFWPFDLESGARVACDVGCLCANFGLPRPLCSRVIPDVRDSQPDRQTDFRQHHRLMPPPRRRSIGGIISRSAWLRLAGYITVHLVTFDKQSSRRRVERASNRSRNRHLSCCYRVLIDWRIILKHPTVILFHGSRNFDTWEHI